VSEPITILNVDDYQPALYARSRLLKQAGYTVVEAQTGQDALRLVSERQPQVVLLDVHLPDISGFDVCRRIKGDPATASTLVVHVSATSIDAENRITGLQGGADSYLTEPVSPRELIAQIDALLRLRGAEAELARLYEEARAANRAKDAFLAVTSHELRTPLTAIMGWLQMLRSDGFDPAKVSHALEVIERNTQAQLRLVDDLLDVSRIVSGRASIVKEPTDLRSLVESAVETIRPAAASAEVAVDLQVGPGRTIVVGDQARLRQVVDNVLTNAVKFTPPAGSIRVALATRGTRVVFTVADTGEGIDPGFLPYVFDRFRQADEDGDAGRPGLGIGLWVARYFVEAHGGTISVSSEGLDQGSTFVVSLPLAAEVPEQG
jgi:signal transduction histidine kinase